MLEEIGAGFVDEVINVNGLVVRHGGAPGEVVWAVVCEA